VLAGVGGPYEPTTPERPWRELAAAHCRQAIVLHAIDAALAASIKPVIVVCGPDAGSIAALLGDSEVTLVPNPYRAIGMAPSPALGISSPPERADGAIVLLGDMPLIGTALIDTLLSFEAHDPAKSAIVPSHNGRRGNPAVLNARCSLPY